MSRASQAINNISPLRAIVYTGTISMIIVIAGIAGFVVTQQNLLETVQKKQACYLDLVDFRGKILEFGLLRNQENSTKSRAGAHEREMSVQRKTLLVNFEKLAAEMKLAGLPPFSALQVTLRQWHAMLAEKNLDLIHSELDKSIEQAKVASKEASVRLVVINEFFLFFILAVLLTLSITCRLDAAQ